MEAILLLDGPHMRNPTPSGRLVDVNLKPTKNGAGTFHKMRILAESSVKAQVPLSTEEVLMSRLASFLSVFVGSGYDMSLPGQALRLMARRVSTSTALSDSIECLITTYEALRQGLLEGDILDSKIYHKALRSLQLAVDDPKQQTSVETLAATTIVHRIQLAYDFFRVNNRHPLHVHGIHAIMTRRGPSSIEGELDVWLILENSGFLIRYFIDSGYDNLYTLPDWAVAIETAVNSFSANSPGLKLMYHLISKGFAKWPVLVKLLQMVESDPPGVDTQGIALKLVSEASATLRDLKDFDNTWIRPLEQCGIISLVEDKIGCTKGYQVKDLDTAQLFAFHAMLSIIVNRILGAALDYLNLFNDIILESQNREWSMRIWRLYPHIRRFRPIAAMRLSIPLMMSIESGSPSERQMVLDIFRDLDESRLPVKDRWTESNLLLHCRTLTGRRVQ